VPTLLFRSAAAGVLAGLSLTSGAAAATAAPLYAPARVLAGSLSNWGGYVATGPRGHFTTAAATWTIPAATCAGTRGLYAPWVGIDGYGNSTVEQTGMQTSCATGSPVVSAWYEMYPAAPVYFSNPAALGDTVHASVTYAAGTFTLVIADTTQGWSHTVHKKLAAARETTAEAVIEAPGGFPATVGPVSFTGVSFDGTPLGSIHPVVTLRTRGNGTSIWTPGPISGGNFTITPLG
jgi:Peptidase A4 family